MTRDSYESCPVCDSDLPEEAEECSNCGAVLKLFDIDVDIDEGVSKRSIERIKNLILENGEDEELREKFREIDFSTIVNEDAEEEVEEIVTFACPICDSEVSENASKCPNCGAIFEEESDEEEFEEDEEISEFGIDEEEIAPEDEEEDMIGVFQDEIEDYQKKIDLFENSGLDMKYLREDISELKEAQSKEEGERISEEIGDKIDHVENIMEITAKCENFLSVLSEKIDVSELENGVDKIYEGCKIGEYKVASKRAENIKKDIVKELNELEDEDWLKDLIDENIEEAKGSISNIKDDVSKEKVEVKIDEASAAKSEGDLEEALHAGMTAAKTAAYISKISDRLEKANKYLDEMKERGVESSEYQDNIENTKRKIEIGEEKAALKTIEECIEGMENRLEELEKEEKKEQDSQKFNDEVSQVESLLEQAQKFDIETSKGEEKRDEAMRYAEEEEYETGLTTLEEVEEQYRMEIENKIDEKINPIKEESDEDLFEKEFHSDQIDKLKDKNDYEKILSLIEEAERNLEKGKDIKEDLNEDSSEIENILEYSEDLKFDMKKVKALLGDAEDKIEEGDWSGARDYIDSCQSTVRQKLLDFLKEEIKNAKKKLSEVEDEDVDVTKPIDFLKDANRARKENELEESFKALTDYKEEMDKIFENP